MYEPIHELSIIGRVTTAERYARNRFEAARYSISNITPSTVRKLRINEIPRLDPQDALDGKRHPISVVVDNIRSIYNVGSIFRTSDAALVEKLYLTGITGTPENRMIHKSALGAQETVPWEYRASAVDAVRKLQASRYTVALLEITDSPRRISELTLEDFPLALVVGNEVTGISDELFDIADVALEIPQFGTKHSLNVAVAFGIAVFDLVRLYRRLHPTPAPQAFLGD